MFPSLRGSFESGTEGQLTLPETSFHPSEEVSKGGHTGGPEGRAGVSIPQRKFRKLPSPILQLLSESSFHPSDEVSKGNRGPIVLQQWVVSIPQRKFRKWHFYLPCAFGQLQFPSLRGSFESGVRKALCRCKLAVSIPQRKFRKEGPVGEPQGPAEGFPSLRGSFERNPRPHHQGGAQGFPSLRGSFESRVHRKPAKVRGKVSIPQRKFRKALANANAPAFLTSFPSLRGSFESLRSC